MDHFISCPDSPQHDALIEIDANGAKGLAISLRRLQNDDLASHEANLMAQGVVAALGLAGTTDDVSALSSASLVSTKKDHVVKTIDVHVDHP